MQLNIDFEKKKITIEHEVSLVDFISKVSEIIPDLSGWTLAPSSNGNHFNISQPYSKPIWPFGQTHPYDGTNPYQIGKIMYSHS